MKKITSDKVITIIVFLGLVALIGFFFGKYWSVFPFLFFTSGVIVGNLNEEDVNNG
jgi:hypothetical protein